MEEKRSSMARYPKGTVPKHLTPWKKGVSGNPYGRKRGTMNRTTIAKMVLGMSVKTIYGKDFIEALKTKYPALTDKVTIEELGTLAIANKMIMDEDTASYKELMDSAYGRSKERPEEEVEPVVVQINLSKNKDLLKNQKIE